MRGIQHHILHAEDDADDRLLIQLAFKKLGVSCTITSVEDGAAAIAYLKGEGDYADRKHFPWPALVLLDIKMPRYSGLEVLEWIRNQNTLNPLPVVMLTASRNLTDISRAYDLGVNAYLVKALEYETLQRTLRTAAEFWFNENVLPE